jgi:hypothetical protein
MMLSRMLIAVESSQGQQERIPPAVLVSVVHMSKCALPLHHHYDHFNPLVHASTFNYTVTQSAKRLSMVAGAESLLCHDARYF